MKIYLLNWNSPLEIKGGCETVFLNLEEFLGADPIYSTHIYPVFGLKYSPDYYPYAVNDRTRLNRDFLNVLDFLEPVDKIIIANDGILPYETNNILVTYSQNPYFDIGKALSENKEYNILQSYDFFENYSELQKKQYDISKEIVVCSEFMREYVKRISGKDSHKIEHGVDIEKFKPLENKKELKEKYSIPKDKKIGIWVGAAHGVKGFKFMRKIVKERQDIFWILIFKHKIEYKKTESKNLKIFDPVDQETLNELYNVSDFLFSTSFIESFNLVAVEAMATNTPVVVLNTGFFFEKDLRDIKYLEYGAKVPLGMCNFISEVITKVIDGEYNPREFVCKNELTKKDWKKRWQDFENYLRKTYN